MKLIRVLGLCLLVGALMGSFALSQAANGALAGSVLDSSGAAVPGAEVKVTSQANQRVYNAITSDVGSFSVPGLVPGPYTVEVALTGFKTFVATDVKVNVGETYSLSVTLEIGDISETVTVTGGADLVKTTDAQLSNTIDKRQIDDLPLNGRNPLNLITLQAGTANNSRTVTSISGNRASYTGISQDGINIQDNFIRSNATTFVPARPSVANVGQFTITTQNQGTESGFGSNQVSLSTPSGTNNYHGRVFWYHRNSAQAANEFFNNSSGQDKDQLIRNQFGLNGGGPILKDKLLFFGFYEGQRIRQSSTRNRTVLTPNARNGIFTYEALDGSIRQLDVLAAQGVGTSPAMQALIGRLPTEFNNFERGDSEEGQLFNTAGLRVPFGSNNDRNQYGFRLDYILSDSHSFEGIYNRQDNANDRPDIYSGFQQDPLVKTVTDPQEFFSTAWKWSLTPTLLNEVRFGANMAPVVFESFEDRSLGFKIGTSLFTNPVDNFERQGRDTRTWAFADNASWQRGAHSFRFGFQSQFIRVNTFSSFNFFPTVNTGISTNQTLGFTAGDFPGGIASSDIGTANALLVDLAGLLTTGSKEFNATGRDSGLLSAPDVKNWEYDLYAFYFGDTWRMTPRLTFNYGVRWEYTPNLRESDDLIVQIIPQQGQSIFDAVLDPNANYDFIDGDLVNNDLNNFAPNLGLAWDLFGDGKTALRLGYGISYVNDEAIRSTDTWLNRFGVAETVTRRGLTQTVDDPLPTFTPTPSNFPIGLPLINQTNSSPGAFAIDPELKLPYVQTWNLGIQREVGWNTAFEARYVGTKGTALRRGVDFNQVDIRSNGFLEDFLRARSNGFLAQQAGGGFDIRFNPNVAGSQELTLLPSFGFLTNSLITNAVLQGRAGQLAFIYTSNGITGDALLQPNPNALFSDVAVNQASSIYHGLQLEARKRFSDGLQFNVNYTFSKVFTDASGTGQTNFEPFTDILDPGYDRGRALFDTTHVFNTNLIWELPFGRGRRWDIENSFLNAVAGGWKFTSIFNWNSGAPFSITSGRGTLNRNGRSGQNRADSALSSSQIRDLLGVVSTSDGLFFIGRGVVNSLGRGVAPDGEAAFSGQVFFNPDPGTLGSLPKFAYNGPSFFNWDFGALKSFDLGYAEGHRLEFRAEFFNFSNTASFNLGDQNINSTNFGRITSTNSSARVVQFALNYIF